MKTETELTDAKQRAVDSDSPLELWKPVIGYEGLYEVSSLGQVRSVPRTVTFIGRWGTERTSRLEGEVLFRFKRKDRYLSVLLSRSGKVRNFTIHRLVVAAFHGLSASEEVNHKDGNKANNAESNLERCSRLENNKHAIRTGLSKPVGPKGTACHFAVINDFIAAEIRKLYSDGLKVSVIARQFKVSLSCVYGVVKNQTWRHV